MMGQLSGKPGSPGTGGVAIAATPRPEKRPGMKLAHCRTGGLVQIHRLLPPVSDWKHTRFREFDPAWPTVL